MTIYEKEILNTICKDLNLGAIKKRPKKVSGGYMHKMYYLITDNGEWAVKLLNPEIMKRPNVFDNYSIAEMLEKKLQSEGLPIVPSLEYKGRKMQAVSNRYYYIFNWINGKSLNHKSINAEHCKIIGSLLAKIHTIKCEQEPIIKEQLNIDWDFYIEQSKTKCPKIAKLLYDNKSLLYEYQDRGNNAFQKLPEITCISNGDMDSKNVLWMNNHPYIIDLECLNYGNPYTEMLQLALCWSGYEECKLDYTRLEAFISSYIAEYGKVKLDCQALYYSNTGRLEWLEYNIKRALMIECENKQEQKLGINQVKETMSHIIYYDKIKNDLINCLEKYFI